VFAALSIVTASGFCPDVGFAAQATARQRYEEIVRTFRDTAAKPPPVSFLPVEPVWSLKLGSSVSAAAVMDDAHVYVALREYTLAALHRETGIIAWTWAGDTVLSMAVAGGELFLVTTSSLHALDAATGYERWTMPIDAGVTAPIVSGRGWIVLVVESGDLLGVRASDGQLVWRQSLGATTTHPPAFGGEGALYASLSDGRVVALGLDKGSRLWERTLPGTLSAPAATSDRVFVGSTDNFFYALNATTGRDEWRWRNGGDVIGATVDNESVYFASLDNILRAVNRGNGNQRWRKPTGTRPVLPPLAFRGVVVVPGLMPAVTVFVGETGMLMGTHGATGDLAGPPLVDPAVKPFRVSLITVTREGVVEAFRPAGLMFRETAAVPVNALPGRGLVREHIQ
jgi:outer membrane protein assembly factor BamB